MKKAITKSDIIPGAMFTTESGIVWIIDELGEVNGKQTVRTSMEGGAKGNFIDYLEDCVEFLNDEKAEKK